MTITHAEIWHINMVFHWIKMNEKEKTFFQLPTPIFLLKLHCNYKILCIFVAKLESCK